MQYLSIPNWDKFQHYKDRSPPWIKLHREMTTGSYEFSCLQDASKAHLMLIWMLASECQNRFPNDDKWIANKIGALSKVDLKPLISAGFLILEQDASVVLAECKQVAIPERETEAYREEREKDIFDQNAFDIFWDAFPRQRRGSRQKAERAWQRALTRARPHEIQQGTEAYASSTEVANGFAKGAEAWLNDDRWTTDYSKEVKHGTYRQAPTKHERLIAAGDEAVRLETERILREDRENQPVALPAPAMPTGLQYLRAGAGSDAGDGGRVQWGIGAVFDGDDD